MGRVAAEQQAPSRRRQRLHAVPGPRDRDNVRRSRNPLALGRGTRARLKAVVQTLLAAPGLAGVPDAVRLAVIILASRTPAATGVVEMRTGELGRWLGMSKSYTSSSVVPGLRDCGVVRTEVAEGEYGEDRGLRCEVAPLWDAWGVIGHPLAVTRKELATLLRLLEVLIAPGWTHRDGSVTPPGLLGTRTGRGAATDRLALLLLVLEATETGRVRLCGGRVDTKRGRPAATVARLMGCTASGGERILERLGEYGAALCVRRMTVSGLAHRSRLIVPAVAAAHQNAVAEDWPPAVPAVMAEPPPSPTEPDDAAVGSEAPEYEEAPQATGEEMPSEPVEADPDDAGTLHPEHSPMAEGVEEGAGDFGLSGEAPLEDSRQPERAGAYEERQGAAHRRPQLRVVRVDDGPLCGEQPNKPRRQQPDPSSELRPEALGRLRRKGKVPRPPADLQVALAPVSALWDRLERAGARRLVVRAAQRELTAVVGLAGADGPQVLAARLTRRLAAQDGPDGVADPVGWLLGRGVAASCRVL